MPRLFCGGVLAHLMQRELERYDCNFYPANARDCSCMPQPVISCSVYLKIKLPLKKNIFSRYKQAHLTLVKLAKRKKMSD